MKFSCERCGKRYATADAPAPGKVYKLKCRGCGHPILVRAPPVAAPPPGTGPAKAAPEAPAPPPASGTAPPEPAGAAAADPTLMIQVAPRAEDSRTPAVPLAAAPGRPAGGPGLPADAPTAAVGDAGYVELFADGEGRKPGEGASDPFAPLRAELEAAARRDTPVPTAPRRPAPRRAGIPRPPAPRHVAPLAVIVAAVVVLLAILALALHGRASPPAGGAVPESAAPPAARGAPAGERVQPGDAGR